MDVYGLIQPCSFGKQICFLLFIDDYSRKIWLYFLKEKSNVFNCFKKFKVLVEKKINYFIKSLRTDREDEFCSNVFCEDQGVKKLLTVPRTP
jgi:hypothetical protein